MIQQAHVPRCDLAAIKTPQESPLLCSFELVQVSVCRSSVQSGEQCTVPGTEVARGSEGGQQKVTICMLSRMNTSPPTSIGSKAACCPFKLHTTCSDLLRSPLCCCCQCREPPMDFGVAITLCFCCIAIAVCADSCDFTDVKRDSGSICDR